jgi:hypothetical protein
MLNDRPVVSLRKNHAGTPGRNQFCADTQARFAGLLRSMSRRAMNAGAHATLATIYG